MSVTDAIIFLAIFEGLQLSILSYQAWLIRRRMDTLIPAGKTGGELLSDAALEFMARIQRDDADGERARQVVGTFIRSSTIAALDVAVQKVPAAKMFIGNGGGVGDGLAEILPKKYQWMGKVVDMVAPQVVATLEAQKANAAVRPAAPVKRSGLGW